MTDVTPDTITDDPILSIEEAWKELLRQGLKVTKRQVERQAVEYRDRPEGLPFRKLFNGKLAIRRSALLKAIGV